MDAAIEAELQKALNWLQNGRPDEAVKVLEVLEGKVNAGDSREAVMLVNGLLAPAKATLGDLEAAVGHATTAHAVAAELGDAEGEQYYKALLDQLQSPPDPALEQAFESAIEALNRGDGAAAVKHLGPLVDASRAQGAADVEASAVGMRASAHMMLGDSAAAEADARRALELAKQTGDPNAVAHFQQMVDGLAAASAGEGGIKALAEQARVSELLSVALDEAGKSLSDDDAHNAIVLLKKALEDAKGDVDVRAGEASVHGMLGQALLMVGSRKEAEVHGTRAVELANEIGDTEAAAELSQALKLIVGWTEPPAEA